MLSAPSPKRHRYSRTMPLLVLLNCTGWNTRAVRTSAVKLTVNGSAVDVVLLATAEEVEVFGDDVVVITGPIEVVVLGIEVVMIGPIEVVGGRIVVVTGKEVVV